MSAVLLLILAACTADPAGRWGNGADPGDDFDGDGFGQADDCDDFDDAVSPQGVEDCGNGEDDDCNGDFDCDDAACAGAAACADPVAAEHCFNGTDDDGDDDVDCGDADCVGHHACSECSIQASGTCDTSWHVFSTFPRTEVAGYSCGGSGGGNAEVVYEFLVLDDATVSVRADPEDQQLGFGGNNVDLYVLEGTCYPDQCLDASTGGGIGAPEIVTFDAVGGVWYYFVVEDVGGSDDEFVLDTLCMPPS